MLQTKVSIPFSDVTVKVVCYSLRSVKVHSGSNNFGHYVSLCYDDRVNVMGFDLANELAKDGYSFILRKI